MNMTATIADLDVYTLWFSNVIPMANTSWHLKYNPDYIEQHLDQENHLFYGRLTALGAIMTNETEDAVRGCISTNSTQTAQMPAEYLYDNFCLTGAFVADVD